MSLTPEQVAQVNIINWFDWNYPELSDDLHHFANERYLKPTKTGSHWMAGRKLKRMGVKKGVADLHLALPQNEFAGLWIELKVQSGTLTPEQKEFLERKIKRGYCAVAVWGEDAAKEVFKTYLCNYATNSNDNILNSLPKNKPIC